MGGKTPFMSESEDWVLLDAGVLIGALLRGDPRHAEARSLVEAARRGELRACTTPSVLSEVYGALTWEHAQPRHDPREAAEATRLLVEPPSALRVLDEGSNGARRPAIEGVPASQNSRHSEERTSHRRIEDTALTTCAAPAGR